MKIISDLHIHSKYSRATSPRMDLDNLSLFGAMKGLHLIGTGDALHPKWFKELSDNLVNHNDGIYSLKSKESTYPKFVITTEVATICEYDSKYRKSHHLILFPDLDSAYQASNSLSSYGSLSSDGRPILSLSPPELVENLISVNNLIEIIPAHIWTPWWSILGSKSGYDSLNDCYQDSSKHIHAIETGLSSDPPMNWRISELDNLTLISNSDCHSPDPYRLGREANIFELSSLSYHDIIQVIRLNDPNQFIMTIETKPEYGKYHWTGHRNCGVSMSPSDSFKINDICPKCNKSMTVGVEQRISSLSDYPIDHIRPSSPKFVYLLPLHEIISTSLGLNSFLSKKVQMIYSTLITNFHNEFSILLNVPLIEIQKIAGYKIMKIIESMRNDTFSVIPGYDGVYGSLESNYNSV